ncbi:MAG: hypothetical protein ACKVVP_06765, partial [Chloroflexota bacterium]
MPIQPATKTTLRAIEGRFKLVPVTTRSTSRYQSPQPWLWEMRDGQWLKALPLPDRPLRPRSPPYR